MQASTQGKLPHSDNHVHTCIDAVAWSRVRCSCDYDYVRLYCYDDYDHYHYLPLYMYMCTPASLKSRVMFFFCRDSGISSIHAYLFPWQGWGNNMSAAVVCSSGVVPWRHVWWWWCARVCVQANRAGEEPSVGTACMSRYRGGHHMTRTRSARLPTGWWSHICGQRRVRTHAARSTRRHRRTQLC